MESFINIIGAGLAGCEAAWQLAERGVAVVLYDMKPHKFSPAHKNPDFAELVCSNSLRSSDFENNAVGLMQEELRRCNSLVIAAADESKVPAGGALAVDRDGFARRISGRIKSHPNITVKNQEISSLPSADFGRTIIATGPLTSEALAQDILKKIDNQALSFYDAIAPVVHKESIDFSKAWYQSRYDKGDKFDYINCPMDKDQYYAFVEALRESVKADFHDFEKEAKYFDGCLPVEVMAERGADTLAHGPMKPVGLTNQHAPDKKPFAVVQLRQDNKEDTLRNLVGFQTKMKHGEQIRILRTIPGLEHAEFARLGGIHKNTFIKSPVLLDAFLRLKKMPHLSFAGQITGCEGYVESAATGYLAGLFAAAELQGKSPVPPPRTTAFGSMLAHLQDDTDIDHYQPMNINFGLFPAIEGKVRGSERKKMYTRRALSDLSVWRERI